MKLVLWCVAVGIIPLKRGTVGTAACAELAVEFALDATVIDAFAFCVEAGVVAPPVPDPTGEEAAAAAGAALDCVEAGCCEEAGEEALTPSRPFQLKDIS